MNKKVLVGIVAFLVICGVIIFASESSGQYIRSTNI